MIFPIVIDASVAVKWFDEQEEDSVNALRVLRILLKKERDFIIPDLFFYELGNVFWKKWKRFPDRVKENLYRLWRYPWFLMPLRPSLLVRTSEISSQYNITFYDSLYVATAERNDALLISADTKLLDRVQSFPFAKHLSAF